MSNGYAFAILIGNVTRDLELRYGGTGTAVVNFGIAINGKRGGKEKVDFFDCTAFGKTAETLAQWVKKGQTILVNARPDYQTWDDKGQKRSKVAFIVNGFEFMGGGQRSENQPERKERPNSGPRPPQPSPEPSEPPEQSDDDSVPF